MSDRPRPVRPAWRSRVVLVCRECDGAKGFGPKPAERVTEAT